MSTTQGTLKRETFAYGHVFFDCTNFLNEKHQKTKETSIASAILPCGY